jgi:hypothetical protein
MMGMIPGFFTVTSHSIKAGCEAPWAEGHATVPLLSPAYPRAQPKQPLRQDRLHQTPASNQALTERNTQLALAARAALVGS